MLCKASALEGLTIGAVDGDIGSVRTVYFTTSTGPSAISWSRLAAGWLRGGELGGRYGGGCASRATRSRDAPEYDDTRPIDREYESALYAYYDRPATGLIAPR
jgi:hypothetical protein